MMVVGTRNDVCACDCIDLLVSNILISILLKHWARTYTIKKWAAVFHLVVYFLGFVFTSHRFKSINFHWNLNPLDMRHWAKHKCLLKVHTNWNGFPYQSDNKVLWILSECELWVATCVCMILCVQTIDKVYVVMFTLVKHISAIVIFRFIYIMYSE